MYDRLQLRHATAVLDRSEDAILAVDSDGIVTSWNSGATRLFGRGPQSALGLPVDRLLATDRAPNSGCTGTIAGMDLDRVHGIRHCRDGRELPVTITAVPVRDARGHTMATTVIVRDVRDADRAERTLAIYREEQARIAVERTRATMAGELHDSALQQVIAARMRLETCIGEVARHRTEELDGHLQFVDGLLAEALRAMRQVMSGISALATPFDTVGAALDAAVTAAAREHGLAVACDATGRVDDATAIAPIVHRVVLEALRNVARHAAADGASVHASVGEVVRVVVADTGCGFDPDRSARGFGLTHAAELVRRCGGTLQVEGSVGDGTTIELQLPLDPISPQDD